MMIAKKKMAHPNLKICCFSMAIEYFFQEKKIWNDGHFVAKKIDGDLFDYFSHIGFSFLLQCFFPISMQTNKEKQRKLWMKSKYKKKKQNLAIKL